MVKRTGTPQFMKSINRATIVDALVKNSPISQTRICEITGLSRATVSTIVNELKQERLIVEVSKEVSTGGRRQTLLKLDENAGYVVGIDLGGTKMVGAVTNLNGKFIVKMRWPTKSSDDDGPETILATLINFIKTLIAKAGVDIEKVRGIGIGVPGVVRPGGVVEWAPNLKWRNLDLASELVAAIKRPVFIENDVNLLALGEYWYGAAQGCQSMACLAVGTGIGAGIIINGQLYSGVHQAAGEICNLLVDRSYLGKDFTQYGCLEMLASGPAIAKQYMTALQNNAENKKNKDNGSNNESGEESNLTGAELVFNEAARDNPIAKQIIEEFSQNISMAIIALTTVLDPDVIVLGGGVSRNVQLFRDRILELCTPVVQVMPRIEVSALGVDAGIMGAIALTLHHTSEKPW